MVQNLGFKAYDTGFSGLIGEGWLIILVQDMECYRWTRRSIRSKPLCLL